LSEKKAKREKEPFAERMGERVQDLLTAHGMSQPEAARLIGRDEDTFGGAIRGYQRFQLEDLIKLSEVFKVTLEYFYGLPDPRELDKEEQELVGLYRAYRSDRMREELMRDARAHYQTEQDLLGVRNAEQ
jgi:transcriptional regulator with XRE-family HTH domain